MGQLSASSVLSVLGKSRLVDLGRELAVSVPSTITKEQQVDRLLKASGIDVSTLARMLTRDELKQVCRAHKLDDSGRSRSELASRILGEKLAAAGPPAAIFGARQPSASHEVPKVGAIVQVRHRQYLVEEVIARPLLGEATRVCLVCLDDDNQGKRLDVLWELELGARILVPEDHGLGEVEVLDPPAHFGAYLNALRWHAVTATDARLFQAPFRAGIELMNHQLTPLKKALALPRANLFIADDVGLGKTIEAGLVLQELLLRQQVDMVLIVAPASVCLQWRDEMQKRFGLRFEIYNRAFMSRRRQERGFGVNPWTTHNRFIISYQTLRRPEYRDPLLARLGERARKSLLILDEAHTAAPATASKYAVDSRITRVIRDLAPRFDNRLFLSATPHNGHSNSFSALLELLDPQRFTRGVRPSAQSLDAVMVRRLKQDLRELGVESFPVRKLVQLEVGSADAPEVKLSGMLAEYTHLMRPERGRGRLVFVNLQKRLLSSMEAFRRTLEVHAQSVAEGRAKTALQLSLGDRTDGDDDDELTDEYGVDDDALDEAAAAEMDLVSRLLKSPAGRARELLASMQTIAAQQATGADAKVEALLGWIREHQCPAVQLGGAQGKGSKLDWSERRVLIFTEYGDTKRYLRQILDAAIEGTRLADERILELHGGMSDDQREEVQRAFNGPPDENPVRILIATDAAREGVNLQGYCADLFHFDLPWNPARIEQRNGRIDRTLQPSPEVRCHYFFYPARPEDIVLEKLVHKVETIQKELGSLGDVVMGKITHSLEDGIDTKTAAGIERAEASAEGVATAKDELETQRVHKKLQADIDDNAQIAATSRTLIDFEPAQLKNVIDVGLAIAGAPALGAGEDKDTYVVPELPDSWQSTLDTLRRARRRDESFWEWRDEAPPQPVVFRPPPRLTSAVAQLHLAHPFVQRILSRFRAQGFSAQDLSRVTALRNPHADEVVAIAFGRLSLFGAGASRLHDQLIPVAAQWKESGGRGHRKPLEGKAQAQAFEQLSRLLRELDPEDKPVAKKVQTMLVSAAQQDFAALWPLIKDEADAVAHDATAKLATRAREESTALTKLLGEQKSAIQRELSRRTQLDFAFTDAQRDQREQYEADVEHMSEREKQIDIELETEPAQIRSLYQVSLTRLEPVGLVYLWPGTR